MSVLPKAETEQAQRDQQLTAEIQRRLREDPVTARYVFGVFVRNGEVVLEGAVPSPYACARAVSVARSVPGVQNVLNKLTPW